MKDDMRVSGPACRRLWFYISTSFPCERALFPPSAKLILYVVLELVTGGDLFDRIVAQEAQALCPSGSSAQTGPSQRCTTSPSRTSSHCSVIAGSRWYRDRCDNTMRNRSNAEIDWLEEQKRHTDGMRAAE